MARSSFGVVRDSAAFGELHLFEQVEVDAVRFVDEAARVRTGHHHRAELVQFLDGVDRHVARARDDAALSVERLALSAQHLLGEEHRPVSRRLGSYQRPTPRDSFAGEHARLVAVRDPLVLPEHEADLAVAHADVAGGNVGHLADVAVQLGHEALAEAHHLAVRAALGVEVGAALAAADRQARQRVLEHLLESEELDHPEVDGRAEAQPTLVRPERAVELHPEPAVHLHLAGVVLPGHPEDDLAFGFADALDDLVLGEFGVAVDRRADRLEHLHGGLVELGLRRVLSHDLVVDGREIFVQHAVSVA